MNYDVFNGDADGICSLHQLRLRSPCDRNLITGVKRDIELLRKVSAQPKDRITVLDISFDKNRMDVERLLNKGCSIEYFDHHHTGEIILHKELTAHIDTAPSLCTSLIVNNYLNSSYAEWAVVGAYGDNLHSSAVNLATSLKLNKKQLQLLEKLGKYINYNGYGENINDLHIHPVELYRSLSEYLSPIDYIFSEHTYEQLEQGYKEDITYVSSLAPNFSNSRSEIYVLPNASWSHRVIGIFANNLAQKNRRKAHAVLIETKKGYKVSVRAPISSPFGADKLCLRYDTGGGRKAAGGINNLKENDFEIFINDFLGHKWND